MPRPSSQMEFLSRSALVPIPSAADQILTQTHLPFATGKKEDWYFSFLGLVLSVALSVRPSICLSVRPSVELNY